MEHVTSSETPQHQLPAQYTETLPDWVLAEIEAGRDKLPELRAAIVAAILGSKGILTKGETNSDQNYKYTGFDTILDAVREPMAKAGLNMEQVSCDVETELHWSNKYGTTTVWKWRVIFLITHVSGGAVARIVRVTTSPGAKCASIASSSADRLMVTRLMRIASGKDEGTPDEGDQGNRGWNAGGPPDSQRRPQETRPRSTAPSPGANNAPARNGQGERAAAEAGRASEAKAGPKHRDLTPEQMAFATEFIALFSAALVQTHNRARLLNWGRILRGLVRGMPKVQVDIAWGAFHARCAEMGLVPNEISAELKTLPPLAWDTVAFKPETGEMHDKTDGTLL